MNMTALIRDIFIKELKEEPQINYAKIYRISSVYPRDQVHFHATLRYRVSREDAFIARIFMNLLETEHNNVQISIVHIKPMKKFTKTIFRKSFRITHTFIQDILEGEPIDILGETMERAIVRFNENRSTAK